MRNLDRGDIAGDVRVSFAGGPLPDWPFRTFINLWTWLLATGPSGVLIPPREHDRSLIADAAEEDALASELFRAVGLRIDPSTPVDAFVWDGDEFGELPDRFYPAESRFHLDGSGPLKGRIDEALSRLAEAIAGPWPLRWAEEAVELARSVLAGEAARYLDYALGTHGLPPAAGQVRDELMDIARDATGGYTLGECYSLLWRVAKDGAAATKRHPMPLASGTTHAVNQFRANLTRARAGKWTLYQYEELGALPLAWQTRTVFGLVFNIDPMHASVDVIRSVVRERLSDDNTVRRQLAEGVPDERAGAACLAISDHVPAYPTVGAAKVFAGAQATLNAVLEAGGTPSGALRAAFFSLELARALGVTERSDIEYCERLIIDAAAGRLNS